MKYTITALFPNTLVFPCTRQRHCVRNVKVSSSMRSYKCKLLTTEVAALQASAGWVGSVVSLLCWAVVTHAAVFLGECGSVTQEHFQVTSL